MPYIESVGVIDDDEGRLTVFAVNRSMDSAIGLALDMRDMEGYRVVEHITMTSSDITARNTIDRPDAGGSEEQWGRGDHRRQAQGKPAEAIMERYSAGEMT